MTTRGSKMSQQPANVMNLEYGKTLLFTAPRKWDILTCSSSSLSNRHHAKWQSPACCLKPQHTLRRAETPEEQSKPLWQGSEPLCTCRAHPSHHRYQLLQSPAHGQHTDSHYVLFLYWATLQRNQSEQSRTSANIRQGDTHSPWPGNIRVTSFSCTISQSTKLKINNSYLLTGGEEGAPACSNSQQRNQGCLLLPGPRQPSWG